MISDPFLNYLALGILFFVVIVLFYGIIARPKLHLMLCQAACRGRSSNLYRALAPRRSDTAYPSEDAKLAELNLHGGPLNRDARLAGSRPAFSY